MTDPDDRLSWMCLSFESRVIHGLYFVHGYCLACPLVVVIAMMVVDGLCPCCDVCSWVFDQDAS